MLTNGEAAGVGKRPLDLLQLDVRRARESLLAGRQQRSPDAAEVLLLRRGLLTALEDYVERLESEHFPVPYALRDELRLHQRLFH